MEKLKLRLSNIEGAEVLSREQLKEVMGGLAQPTGNCAYNYLVPTGGGSYSQAFGSTTVSGTCAQQIAQCQAFADNLAYTTGYTVHYDTACDGVGV